MKKKTMDMEMCIQKLSTEIRAASPESIPTDEQGMWNFNVEFTNTDGENDCMQFDIRPHRFDHIGGKCAWLLELWKEFCADNGFEQNSITKLWLANL